MNPVFIVKRTDGLTDNIFEYDFKNGKFIGGADNYSYKDIENFVYVPSEVLASLFVKEDKCK